MSKERWPKTTRKHGLLFTAELDKDFDLFHDTVVYSETVLGWRFGIITLPYGWQDMDRTWTAQDIYWEDKYDCRPLRERVPPFTYRMPPMHFIDKTQKPLPSF